MSKLLIAFATTVALVGPAAAGDALVCGIEQGTCRPLREEPRRATADYCARVRPTSDGFLALRKEPSAKSEMIAALPSDSPMFIRANNQKPKSKNWVYVNTGVTPDDAEGWVYGKYISRVTCWTSRDFYWWWGEMKEPLPK